MTSSHEFQPIVIKREHLASIIVTAHSDDDYQCVTLRCDDEPIGGRSRSMRPSEALATADALRAAAVHLDPALATPVRDVPEFINITGFIQWRDEVRERLALLEGWREREAVLLMQGWQVHRGDDGWWVSCLLPHKTAADIARATLAIEHARDTYHANQLLEFHLLNRAGKDGPR